METSRLNKFAQAARQDLLEQVGSKLAVVLKPESSARRQYPSVVNQLEKAMAAQGKRGLIDQVAYTWFNRFCALRFMDVNGYNSVGVVSPAEGQTQAEILAEAKSGVIDDTQNTQKDIDQIRELLSGSIPSHDAQSEAYRLLIVGACNALYERMPYMFERIQDFTELLMPDDLLSESSVLAKMRAVMTPEACQDVEVIGWLYQFYISEKKDEVFARPKNQKITVENIPAATQLFTPHWIVRYLVENSLGRLWLLNRPSSKLSAHMEYYIAPEEPETDFLKIRSPEELRIADPAVGSGHMLTYAFDLLYAIYEEEGYDPNEIPGLIIKHNLYGIEIDGRAGALASFALEMKVAEKLGRRRFFKMEAKPNVCVFEDVAFSESEMNDVIAIVGKDLYTADLRETLTQFEQATNFGSLVVPKLKDPAETARLIKAKDFSGDLLLSEVNERLVKVLQMAEYLSPKYHVVVANPPYLGDNGMNGPLSVFAKENYPDSKSDLFAMFMERTLSLTIKRGMMAMINMQSWMFLSSYEKLRGKLLTHSTILTMVHLGERAFDTIGGAVVSTTAFVIQNAHHASLTGDYARLVDGNSEAEKSAQMREAVQNPNWGGFYRRSAEDFGKIPGSPLAYWACQAVVHVFDIGQSLNKALQMRKGLATSDNNRFLREWFECNHMSIGMGLKSRKESETSAKKWFPLHKGGTYRKWYGNHQSVINWEKDGYDIRNFYDDNGKLRSRPQNLEYSFKPALTWSKITSKSFSARFCSGGFLFDDAGAIGHSQDLDHLKSILPILTSKIGDFFLKIINPTLNYQIGDVGRLPVIALDSSTNLLAIGKANRCIKVSEHDWNAYESSWDFTILPLLSPDRRAETLEATYTALRTHWQGMTDEMQRLEEENNRIFIDAYGLQDELTPEVPLKEISLTCNPAYRYGIKSDLEANETRLRADTVAEFLSYAVGCMFGRYSMDESGLILANQGETLADYLSRIPEPIFMPDDDNVIPMIDLEGDWFEDDISERFKQFLRVTFGDEHYGENLAFIEDALGKSIQKYFVKDFYNDHWKRYKKRPIYWLFSSPKGTFNALVYMHRYTPSTVSVVLNDYLREFRTKLEARKNNHNQISISSGATQKEKTEALKMIDKLNKSIDEVNVYEREVLYPLAGQNIAIDLDDGVKHNYPLFGTALKNITGLS